MTDENRRCGEILDRPSHIVDIMMDSVPNPARRRTIVVAQLHGANVMPVFGQAPGESAPTPGAVPRSVDKQDAGHAGALPGTAGDDSQSHPMHQFVHARVRFNRRAFVLTAFSANAGRSCGQNVEASSMRRTGSPNALHVPVVGSTTAAEHIDMREAAQEVAILGAKLSGVAGVQLCCVIELRMAATR